MPSEYGFNDCPIVVVNWFDPSGRSGWMSISELRDVIGIGPLRCRTVGHLVNRESGNLHIALSMSTADPEKVSVNTVGDTICIPEFCIESAYYLSPKISKWLIHTPDTNKRRR